MRKILAGVALLLLVCGFTCGVFSVFYAWAIWAMVGCFTAGAVLCIIVNEYPEGGQ